MDQAGECHGQEASEGLLPWGGLTRSITFPTDWVGDRRQGEGVARRAAAGNMNK